MSNIYKISIHFIGDFRNYSSSQNSCSEQYDVFDFSGKQMVMFRGEGLYAIYARSNTSFLMEPCQDFLTDSVHFIKTCSISVRKNIINIITVMKISDFSK
jgi:hypothetical protein